MDLEYTNPDDLVNKLHNSILLYKGEHVRVVFRDRPTTVDKVRIQLADMSYKSVYIKDEDLDCGPFELGYLNFKGPDSKLMCSFLSRHPGRVNRDGLPPEYIKVSGETQLVNYVTLPGPEFNAMLKGVYPTFEEALSMIKEKKATSVAFNRDYCIKVVPSFGRVLGIYYRNTVVALENPSGFRIVESPRASFFINTLQTLGAIL